MKKILITGVGGGGGTGFIKSLKNAPEKFYFIGVESKPENAFYSVADETYIIPSCDSKKYIESINKIIEKNDIEGLWAQSQIEVQTISKFRNEIKTKIFLPDEKVVDLCYDKYKTLSYLDSKKIPVPKSILLETKSDITRAFKMFGRKIWLREIKGVAGKGAFLASNFDEAVFWLHFNNGFGKFTASEYLSGKNYGCDMLFYKGKLIFSQLKQRLEYVMAKANIVGITGTTGVLLTVENQELSSLCEKVIRTIDQNPNGAYAVDLKCDEKGNTKVTEINCGRYLSSSVVLFHKIGFNVPYYTFSLMLNGYIKDKIKKINPIKKNLIMARQLDNDPVIYNIKDLKKIKDKLEKKSIVMF